MILFLFCIFLLVLLQPPSGISFNASESLLIFCLTALTSRTFIRVAKLLFQELYAFSKLTLQFLAKFHFSENLLGDERFSLEVFVK